MKKRLLLVSALLMGAYSFAQAPEKMSYQAVVRNAGNALVSNSSVGIRISILQGSSSGTAEYVETHTTTTNANGLATLEIGSGTVVTGTIAGIDWANGPYFIKTETDPTGGTNYTITGTSQLMSVPYALYAANSAPGPQGPQGTTGNGIASTVDNGDGTFTFNYTDGSSFTTSNLTGATGATGVAGNGIASTVDNGDGTFTLNFTDGSAFTTSNLTGATGATGNGIASTVDNGNGTFTLNFTDGGAFTTSNLTGPTGATGNGIASTVDNGNGTFTLNYTDGSSFTTANLTGPTGATGATGNGIASTVDNGNGTFTLNYTDGSSFTTSNLTGPTGATGATGATGPAGPIAGSDTEIIFNNAGAAGASSNLTWNNTTSTLNVTGKTVTNNLNLASAAGSGTRYLTTDNTGDISAVAFPGITGSGNNGYHTKWTASGTLVNSMIQDNGTSVSVNYPIQANSQLFVYRQQITANGDGQSTIYGYRDRLTQNIGASYGQNGSNTGVTGMSFWGDDYSFGVGGWNYNDFTRTGGVVGGEIYGLYWGSLGYKAASTVTYGVYGSNAMGSGTGFLPTGEVTGIGGGLFGSMIGSVTKGDVIGQLNAGELFATYNSGNTYTTGKNIELVKTGEASTPVYAVTSVDAKIYNSGTTQLVNGQAYIAFDANYKSLLGENPVVTVTPNGNCNGVYIASVDKNGFTVKEMNNGTSTVSISWISVGNRIDNRMEEATKMVSAPGFDRSIQQVLISDSNTDATPEGIWWDGKTIRFGKLPAHLTTVKRPAGEGK